MKRISLLVLAVVALAISSPAAAGTQPDHQIAGRVVGAMAAPQLWSPANGARPADLGPITLRWEPQTGVAQFNLLLTPFHNDGPGLNIIIGAPDQVRAATYTIPPPVLGKGSYLLLPGMHYSWQVRVTDFTEPVDANHPSWGPWSEAWSFQTPQPSSAQVAAEAPHDGAVVSAGEPITLVWSHANPALFYWEVQVSGDDRFDADSATATSFVWWNIVHGGVSDPLNSWRTPDLDRCAVYYWRVRPRVQGGGEPVSWSATFRFATSGYASNRSSPDPSNGGAIAYLVRQDRNLEINVMPADGCRPARLTYTPTDERDVAWSPKGDTVAFVSERDGNDEIYVMNADGSGLKRLTDNVADDRQPAWSPDGLRIAFTSERDGHPEIYIISADGRNSMRFTEGANNSTPAWSPDGTRIAFTARQSGNPDIYVKPVFNGPLVRLTDNPAEDSDPKWSPDGSKITFTSTRDNGVRQIYVMNADGRAATRLTQGPFDARDAVWSPDGAILAYTSFKDGHAEIYLMDADGRNPTRITHEPTGASQPAWTAAAAPRGVEPPPPAPAVPVRYKGTTNLKTDIEFELEPDLSRVRWASLTGWVTCEGWRWSGDWVFSGREGWPLRDETFEIQVDPAPPSRARNVLKAGFNLSLSRAQGDWTLWIMDGSTPVCANVGTWQARRQP